MTGRAAILATFATWRPVAGRKVLQLVFEVPLEQQAEVLTHLGAPMPMAEEWFGIAKVKKSLGDAPTREDGGAGVHPVLPTSPAKPKKRWNEMPASQRAAMLINDGEFQVYAARRTNLLPNESAAEYLIKQSCRVDQKRQLVSDADAAERFDALEGEFRAWRQAKQLGAA